MQLDDVIDTAVGVVWRHKAGDEVAAGDVLCDIHHRAGHGLEVARAELSAAVHVGAPPELPPLVLARQTS
jgi:thymidine phosphorylase